MSTIERKKAILEYMRENGSVSVRKLCSVFYVSEATIRRDLTDLEKSGALKRTFGGAIPAVETNPQIPLFIREAMNSGEKNEICRQAAALIRDGNTIFIDGSSTAQCLVKYLRKFQELTVVTYSLKTAMLLSEAHIQTYCTGGLLLENSLIFTGPETVGFAERVNPDLCFMSCKGLNTEGIFTDTSDIETPIRREFLKCSQKRVFLMTENKIGNTYFHTLCHSTDVDYIFTVGTLPPTVHLRGK